MNKKALSEHAFFTLFYLVIFVIFFSAIIYMVYNIFYSGAGGEQRTAEVALDSLSQAVFSLIAVPDTFKDYASGFPLFIQSGYTILAFNAEDKQISEGCSLVLRNVDRPAECPPSLSCLCLYETQITGFNPILCKQFPKNVIFSAPSGSFDGASVLRSSGWNTGLINGAQSIQTLNAQNPFAQYLSGISQTSYENLYLPGYCDNKLWQTQNVYIDKLIIGGNIYVFIARATTSTIARNQALKKAFPLPAPVQPSAPQPGQPTAPAPAVPVAPAPSAVNPPAQQSAPLSQPASPSTK
jgi:hypothetical protein